MLKILQFILTLVSDLAQQRLTYNAFAQVQALRRSLTQMSRLVLLKQLLTRVIRGQSLKRLHVHRL